MNKLFATLIIISLALPVTAISEQEAAPVNNDNLEVLTEAEIDELNSSSDKNIEDVAAPETLPNKFKEPVSKKKLAEKFIIAMLCVAGTSIFLYVSLSLYNKLRDGISSQDVIPTEGEAPLETPGDLTDAVKTFIDKTHWEG